MEESQDLDKNGKRAIVQLHTKHVNYHDSLAWHALLPTNYVVHGYVRCRTNQSIEILVSDIVTCINHLRPLEAWH